MPSDSQPTAARPLQAIRAEVRGVVTLALPIVVGMAAGTLLVVTDSVLVAPLGPEPLAAAGLAGAFALVVGASVYGLLSAVPVRIGAAVGARAGRRIPEVLRSGLVLGAMAGTLGAAAMLACWPLLALLGQPPEVLAILFPYWCLIAAANLPMAVLAVFMAAFEATGRPWTGTAFAYLAVVLNVPLTSALIWGPGPFPALGLTGAGIGTLVAQSAALLAAWAWWALAPSLRRLRARGPARRRELAGAAREGAPMGLMYLAETGAFTVATLIVGTFGAVALAANQVAMSVGNVLYMFPLGIAQAVAIRVAQAQGAGHTGRLRPVAWAGLAVATCWLGTAAVGLTLGGRWIAGLISPDPEVVAVAATILAVIALMQVFDGVQTTMVGALRGLSDTGFPAVVTLVAYWGLGLPLALWFSRGLGMGPAGVWTGWLVALAGAGAVLVWRFRHRTAAGGIPAGARTQEGVS